MSYWADLDADSEVVRVIVCDVEPDDRWPPADRWEETRIEPTEVRSQEQFAGRRMGWADNRPERFAQKWEQPEGAHDAYREGEVRWDAGYLWRNVVDYNAHRPGVSGWWREDDVWVQPTGAHDAYPKGHHVLHQSKRWNNTRHANDREPGTSDSGWIDITNQGKSKGKKGGKGRR